MSEKDKNTKLKNIQVKDPFHAPVGYFETFGDRIQDRIDKSEGIEKDNVWDKFPGHIWYSAAAVVAVLIVAFLAYHGFSDNPQERDYLSEVSTEDLIAYLENSDLEVNVILNSLDPEALDFEAEGVFPDGFPMDDEEMKLLYDKFKEYPEAVN